MAEYKIKAVCQNCGGDGLIYDQNSPEGSPSTVACGNCSGTGEVTSNLKLDTLWDKLVEIKQKLDNTKEKCDAIKDKCDQIWDKVK